MDDATIAQFAAITGSSDNIARQYLGLAEGNTEQAIELYYANEGAALESPSTDPQPNTVPPQIPPASTRPVAHRQNHQAEDEIIDLDSDQEDQDDDDNGDDNDVMVTGHTRRQRPESEVPPSSSRGLANNATSAGHAGLAINDDEAMARRLQEEFYGGSGRDNAGTNGTSEMLDEYGYRAPLGRTTETLVGPGSFDPTNAEEMRSAVYDQMMARRHARRRKSYLCNGVNLTLTIAERPGVFNQATDPSIWNDTDRQPDIRREQLSQATGGASEASSRNNKLAEMYRPPFELMSRLPWDQARQQGKDGEKWLLVNIQDSSIFDCQLLNRDIWKHPGITDTVKENFIFMQYSKDDPQSNQYIQYYFQDKDNQDAYPHIAIIDPRTGEKVKVWSGPPSPKAMDFLMQLHEFLDRYSLKATAKNPVARRKPEAKPETQIEKMTEEQMMEMALQASMAGTEEGKRIHDPDDLTRSVGDVEEVKRKESQAERDHDSAGTPSNTKTTNGSSAAVISPFKSISSSSPHTEPAPDASSVTRIQFRHPNGRVVRRFALAEAVRHIFEWLKASPLEGKEGVEFELIFMGKNLIDMLDHTIEQAGLRNGTVMVELIEN